MFGRSSRLHRENVRKIQQLVLQNELVLCGKYLKKKYILLFPKREKAKRKYPKVKHNGS